MNCKSNFIRKYIPATILLLSCYATFPLFGQIETITERLRNELIAVNVSDTETGNLLNTLQSDGSWADIDYSSTANTNWPAVNHTSRLKLVCIAYNKPTSTFYHSAELKVRIKAIIDFYIATKPSSANWWYNAIGAPLNLGPALVLLKTGDSFGFDKATLISLSDKLLNYYSESALKWPFSTTGANKIWLLNSSIYKACICENEEVLASNFKGVFEEAVIMDGIKEGIKSDHSFYQHGAQIYSAGYGMSFLSDITYFGSLSHETTFQMTDDQLKVLTDVILDGFRWFCQKSAFDFGVAGREISRSGAVSSSSLKTYIGRLMQMNAPRADELTSAYNFINGTEDFRNPGNKYFWKSEMMVQHGPKFYLSAKIPSTRTIGTEKMNGENLKRKNLPWGATNIMIDGDEYRGLFPVWDWARIPGVTSVKESVPPDNSTNSYILSLSGFSGGVSDGTYGFAAYDYIFDGITGRKAWFFTPEAMYCLGAGIRASRSYPVITSINQCFSSGSVTMKSDGKVSSFDGAETVYSDADWVYHDRIGYFFPSGGELVLKNANQTGTWNEINTSQSSALVTQKVFSAWINHGLNPVSASYEYYVVPTTNQTTFESWLASNTISLIANTEKVQAVREKKSGIFAVAFYTAGSLKLEYGLTITADKPCLILIQRLNNDTEYKISVSDPSRALDKVNLTLTRKLSGQGAVLNSDLSSTLTFNLPEGELAGTPVKLEFLSEVTTGVSDNVFNSFKTDFSIYPNPSHSGFTASGNSEVSEINVFDKSGKLCLTLDENSYRSFGDSLFPGLYLLRIEFRNKERLNYKVIKI